MQKLGTEAVIAGILLLALLLSERTDNSIGKRTLKGCERPGKGKKVIKGLKWCQRLALGALDDLGRESFVTLCVSLCAKGEISPGQLQNSC